MIFALLVGCGGWRARDTAAETLVLASFAVDHRQTIAITGDCLEANPVIGPCGERVGPTAYFWTAGLIHVGIAAALPPRWRTAFQAVTAGRQVYGIRLNTHAGYGLTGDRR